MKKLYGTLERPVLGLNYAVTGREETERNRETVERRSQGDDETNYLIKAI